MNFRCPTLIFGLNAEESPAALASYFGSQVPLKGSRLTVLASIDGEQQPASESRSCLLMGAEFSLPTGHCIFLGVVSHAIGDCGSGRSAVGRCRPGAGVGGATSRTWLPSGWRLM